MSSAFLNLVFHIHCRVMLRLVHQAIARRLQRLPPAAAAGWAPFSSGAEAADLAFRYVRHNGRPAKPRTKGLTDIRPARLRWQPRTGVPAHLLPAAGDTLAARQL